MWYRGDFNHLLINLLIFLVIKCVSKSYETKNELNNVDTNCRNRLIVKCKKDVNIRRYEDIST